MLESSVAKKAVRNTMNTGSDCSVWMSIIGIGPQFPGYNATGRGFKGLPMERKGFSLLELLVVMSIILVLLSISLPCLLRAKDSALALAAMGVQGRKRT